jgi:CO dehydrogenase maturation factor
MDMVAGLEHLGRGTARRMDVMIVVVEPRMKSVDTVKRVLKLASDIEVQDVLAVGNKIGSERERLFVETKMEELGVPIAAYIPLDDTVAEADMIGKAPIDHNPDSPAIREVAKLKDYLKQQYQI